MKTKKRFVVVNHDEIELIDDLLKYKKENPSLYVSFYDTQDERWVDVGKRGPIKAKYRHDPFCNVIADIKNSEGMITLDQLKENFKRSEDTLTAFDIARWEKKRQAAISLGLVENTGDQDVGT